MTSLTLAVAKRIVDRALSNFPESILDASGRALYSPIDSLTSGSPIYFLGINPGEAKTVFDFHDRLTVREDLRRMSEGTATQHAYLDESWDGCAPGVARLQMRGRQIFDILCGGNAIAGEQFFRRTPVSNMILTRSRDLESLKSASGKSDVDLAVECWPFHAGVIEESKCKVVLTHAVTVARKLAQRWKLGPGSQRPSGWGGSLSTLYAWLLPEGARLLAIPSLSRYDPTRERAVRLRAFFEEFGPGIATAHLS